MVYFGGCLASGGGVAHYSKVGRENSGQIYMGYSAIDWLHAFFIGVVEPCAVGCQLATELSQTTVAEFDSLSCDGLGWLASSKAIAFLSFD